MNNDELSNPYFEQAKREHRELHHLLCELGDVLRTGRPQECQTISAPLGKLREFLACHFAQEENGGFLDEAVSLMPRLGPQVDILEREHPSLLCQLDQLIDLATDATKTEGAWQDMMDKYGQVVKALRLHEAGEDAVIQEASHMALNGNGNPGG